MDYQNYPAIDVVEEPDLVAFDGLHPSGKMYAEWVERILNEAKLNHAKELSEESSNEDEVDDGDGK